MKKLLSIIFALCMSSAVAQSVDAPNVTATAKGTPVCIQLKYADAPSLAMLFANSQCQGMPLRYQMLRGGYGNYSIGGHGNMNQNRRGYGMQNGMNQNQWGQGAFGQGNMNQWGQGRGRNFNNQQW